MNTFTSEFHTQASVREQSKRGQRTKTKFRTFSYGKQSLEAVPFPRKGHFFWRG